MALNRRSFTRGRSARRPYLRGLLVLSVALATLAFAGWVVWFSSWLAVDKVVVSGEHTIPVSVLVTTADIPGGTPMVSVNLDEITHRIAGLPAVAHASVHRSWPHTITISVTERQPLAQVPRAGAWWVIDASGTVFRKSATQTAGLPIAAIHAEVDHEVLHEVALVVAALPKSLLGRVRTVEAASMDSISLVLTSRHVVRWGSAAQSIRKAQVLAVLLKQPARAYDVSVPADPTLTRG
ncbi:MAG: cell division protein FtsQ/DivIB [Nocardioidaceae bacterium]